MLAYRKTDKELRVIARDTVIGQIFLANDPQVIKMSFMILFLAEIKQSDAQAVGAVYEYMDKAGPRSINGYPMFLSARFIHINDMPKLFSMLDEYSELLKVE